jgi:phosphoglycerate dehydrogenase-like enzyme
MTGATRRKRPVVAALYREALPPRLAEVQDLAEVRLTKADGLAKAMDGADVLYQRHSFSPALRENWGAASSLKWVHVTAAGVSQLMFDELIQSDITYTNSRGVLSTAIAEFALGFVLDMAKDSQGSFRLQQEQRWQHRTTRKIQGQTARLPRPRRTPDHRNHRTGRRRRPRRDEAVRPADQRRTRPTRGHRSAD